MQRSKILGELARCPRFWLALQLGAVIGACAWIGLGKTVWPPVGDSVSYINASKAPFREALAGPRTLGYPLLLKCVAWFSPEYRPMPWLCFSLLAASVFFFDASLRRFGASPWMSLAASSGLIYAALPVRTPVAQLLTDFCSMLLAVIAVGFLLRLVANRKAPIAWLGLTASLAATYQVRPAYLFLVPLIPVLGVVFTLVRKKAVGERLAWKCFFSGLLAACALPLLAWCCLRLWMVGDFGLVSFAGNNLSGLAVELLDQPMVDRELSPRFHQFGQAILADRRRLGVPPAFGPGMRVGMRQYEDNFGVNVFRIGKPNVLRFFGADPVVANRELTAFSREVIGLRKGRFLLWSGATFLRAATKVVSFEWIVPPLLRAAAILFLLRLWLATTREAGAEVSSLRRDAGLLPTMAVLAVPYFLACIGFVCLSGSAADSRLVVPAGIFFPSLLLLAIADQGEKIYSLCRKGKPCSAS